MKKAKKENFFENLHEHGELKYSSDRSFGFVFAVFFSLLTIWPLFSGRSPRWGALALAFLFLATALLFPRALGPLNRLWAKLGLVLQKIMTPLIMGVLFYLLFTPIGVLLRIFGKDPMRKKLEPQSKTYWMGRGESEPKPQTLSNQF